VKKAATVPYLTFFNVLQRCRQMKIAVSGRTKLVTVLSIIAFFMIAVVSSYALTGKRLRKDENNFSNDELKVQGAAAEHWASGTYPEPAVPNTVSDEKSRMAVANEVIYAVVAAAICEAYPINDDPDQAGEELDNF
jgi:hypothetical protein